MLILLIILDLFWSIAAIIYDSNKLATIPAYFWLFVAICPIYPLLLALLLLQLYLKKRPNQFLLAFAAIPSIIFGALAIFFYPLAMIYQGFSWNALGQIFWVLFYGSQGAWLIKNYKIDTAPFLFSGLFAIFVLIFQYVTDSYGYLDFENIPRVFLLVLLGIGSALFFSIFFLTLKRRIS